MATKTITIDIEAYKRLKRAKKEEESFSQAIKRLVPQQREDFEEWLRKLRKNPFSEDMIAAVEERITQRRQPRNRKG